MVYGVPLPPPHRFQMQVPKGVPLEAAVDILTQIDVHNGRGGDLEGCPDFEICGKNASSGSVIVRSNPGSEKRLRDILPHYVSEHYVP